MDGTSRDMVGQTAVVDRTSRDIMDRIWQEMTVLGDLLDRTCLDLLDKTSQDRTDNLSLQILPIRLFLEILFVLEQTFHRSMGHNFQELLG